MPEFAKASSNEDTNHFSLDLQFNEVLNFHNNDNLKLTSFKNGMLIEYIIKFIS